MKHICLPFIFTISCGSENSGICFKIPYNNLFFCIHSVNVSFDSCLIKEIRNIYSMGG